MYDRTIDLRSEKRLKVRQLPLFGFRKIWRLMEKSCVRRKEMKISRYFTTKTLTFWLWWWSNDRQALVIAPCRVKYEKLLVFHILRIVSRAFRQMKWQQNLRNETKYLWVLHRATVQLVYYFGLFFISTQKYVKNEIKRNTFQNKVYDQIFFKYNQKKTF